jgi:thymidine kinase
MTEFWARPQFSTGWVEIIVGCMFSGKTEELIKQVQRAEFAKLKWQAFKPRIDARYSESEVCSHSQIRLASIPVKEAGEIPSLVHPETRVVAIDEGQFFDATLVQVAQGLADAGKRVLIAGLDTDWRGRPFGPMPHLLAISEVVRKQYAICVICGNEATRTQRLVAAQDDILVGSSDCYEARCRAHFDPEVSLRPQKPPLQGTRPISKHRPTETRDL